MKRFTVLLALLLGAADAQAQFSGAPACSDGMDNDDDGATDYSATVGQGDPGCDSWNDTSEANINFSAAIKPRLVIAFDTSGSMSWNVCTTDDNPQGGFAGDTGGDGSRECPGSDVECCNNPIQETELCVRGGTTHQDQCDAAGCDNNVPDDSRLFKVKRGVYDAVAAYGEIEYSLYRFNASGRSWPSNGCGGWSGGNACAGANRLVKFAPENQEYILQWMDGTSNWDPGDHHPPSGLDFELRSTGSTPLAGTLNVVRSDVDTIRLTDPKADCRPYRVVLVTDGQETCSGDPVSAATALHDDDADVYVIGFAGAPGSPFVSSMDEIAEAGGTGQAYFADDPAELSAALADIVSKTVLVEKCNGMDDDCDGVPDNGFNLGPCDNGQQGKCYAQGQIVCTSDTTTACNAPHINPTPEEPGGCNGIDDDCDGLIDDGLQCAGCGTEICNGLDDDCDGTPDDGDLPGEGDECQFSEGECSPGHFECKGGKLVCTDYVGPAPEICDGKDNNCDGVIDGLIRACYEFPTGCIDTDPSAGGVKYECKGRCRAGSQTCTLVTQPNYSTCVGQQGPQAELCNGQDDDCDGTVDDGFETRGMVCERGIGLCKSTGHLVCSADGTKLECDAPVVTGSEEVCNGVDDDCNNVIDDLPDPPPSPIGEPCGTCGGVFACRGGLVCMGGTANAETCNGLDDDCNNIADDGVLPGVGDACVPTNGSGQPLFQVVGECRAGHKECISGGLSCVGPLGPQTEVCDGKDNDCDGVNDDFALCDNGTDACFESQCVSPCGEGEFPCPIENEHILVCRMLSNGRFCVPNPCDNKTCATGEVCNAQTNFNCANPCAGVVCPTDSVCQGGLCKDCFTLGCPTGQECTTGEDHVGHCKVNLCAGITCGAKEMCKEGVCVGLPCPDGCMANERCEGGACVSSCSVDFCASKICNSGLVCNPANGLCAPDPCASVGCGAAVCQVTCEGTATCGLRVGVAVLATGGGGFQCEIGAVSRGTPRGLLAMMLVCSIALMVIRRRRR